MEKPFSVYFNEKVRSEGFDRYAFAHAADLLREKIIDDWCLGERLPEASDLNRVAEALKVDPIDLSLIWVASACPELEGKLLKELIERGTRRKGLAQDSRV